MHKFWYVFIVSSEVQYSVETLFNLGKMSLKKDSYQARKEYMSSYIRRKSESSNIWRKKWKYIIVSNVHLLFSFKICHFFINFFTHFRSILTTQHFMGHKVSHFRNRQKTSVTPLKIFAPEVGIVKRIRTAFVLGEPKAIVIEENVYRS